MEQSTHEVTKLWGILGVLETMGGEASLEEVVTESHTFDVPPRTPVFGASLPVCSLATIR